MEKLYKSNKFLFWFNVIFALVLFILPFCFNHTYKNLTYETIKAQGIIKHDLIPKELLDIISNDYLKLDKDMFYTKVKIRNNGNEPITKDDLRDSLKISVENSYIVEYRIAEKSQEYIKINSSLDSNKLINIDWNYLDPNEYIVLEIVYLSDEYSKLVFKESIFKVSGVTASIHLYAYRWFIFGFLFFWQITGRYRYIKRYYKYEAQKLEDTEERKNVMNNLIKWQVIQFVILMLIFSGILGLLTYFGVGFIDSRYY
jgi:hypothetical protein